MDEPRMFRVRQTIEAPRVDDMGQTLNQTLSDAGIDSRIKEGSRIAVTAGSRGIANIDKILGHLVDWLKRQGARPFLVPAMGSHGGGTAEGQKEVLESLNITEAATGAPIISSMEVKEIGTSRFGFPVYVDRHAAEADGIVVVNRIKPHTEFEGPIESGLMKMMAIGLGKHKGCFAVHQQTVNHGYRNVIPEIGGMILDRLPVVCGIAILENVYDETAVIRAIPPEDFLAEEERLLQKAKRLMARLPFDAIDVLIVEEMGKNISGTGMDTNVIGRIMFVGEAEPERPDITRIVVLDLTEAAHGNAVGIGLADFTTRELVDRIDHQVLAVNAIAAMTPEKGRIPIALETEQQAIEAALDTIGAVPPDRARIVHIKNTLELGEMEISESLVKEMKGRGDLEVVEASGPLSFDARGRLERRLYRS